MHDSYIKGFSCVFSLTFGVEVYCGGEFETLQVHVNSMHRKIERRMV